MTRVGKTVQRAIVRVAGALSIAAVMFAGCGESRSTLDAGSKDGGRAGSGGGAGITGSGGSAGTPGTGGTGGGRDGGFDLNLDGLSFDGLSFDGLSFDGIRFDLAGADIPAPACPANVKTGDACTAMDTACQSSTTFCLCFMSRWTCFSR